MSDKRMLESMDRQALLKLIEKLEQTQAELMRGVLATGTPQGCIPVEAYKKLETGEYIVLGQPEENDSTHNCDQMGCGSGHVMARFRPAPVRLFEDIPSIPIAVLRESNRLAAEVLTTACNAETSQGRPIEGVEVLVVNDYGVETRSFLTGIPWKVGGENGRWVVSVNCKRGAYDCSRVALYK